MNKRPTKLITTRSCISHLCFVYRIILSSVEVEEVAVVLPGVWPRHELLIAPSAHSC